MTVAILLAATTVVNAAALATIDVGTSFSVVDLNGGQSPIIRFLPSTGSLYFSNGTNDPIGGIPSTAVGGLVGAINVGKVALTSVDGSTVTETIRPVGVRTKNDVRANVQIDANVVSLTADTATGNITNVRVVGGALESAAPLEGILEGGNIQFNNLNIDLVSKTVRADLLGNAGTGLETRDTGLSLFTFASVTGPSALPTASALRSAYEGNFTPLNDAGFTLNAANGSFQAVTVLNGLKVTQAGFDAIANALGLTGPSAPGGQGSTGYEALRGVNSAAEGWGAMKAVINFSAVPEPSTYALMGLGLAGMSWLTRRRQHVH